MSKMAVKLLFLMLPTLTLANMRVEFTGNIKGMGNSNMKVEYSGEDINLLNYADRKAFKLSDGYLKEGVRTYFGRRPDDAFLNSPTPWGDLYKTYNWNEVRRTLRPVRAEIIKITSEPYVALTKTSLNNLTNPITVDFSMVQMMESSVSSNWTNPGQLSVDRLVDYSYGEDVDRSMAYSAVWGVDSRRTDMVTVGSYSPMMMELKSNQSVTAKLLTTKVTAQIKIVYRASLSGSVAVSYNQAYRGHHFWATDINGVMNSAGLENKMEATEMMDIVIFSNTKIVITDNKTNMKLKECLINKFVICTTE